MLAFVKEEKRDYFPVFDVVVDSAFFLPPLSNSFRLPVRFHGSVETVS